MLFWLNSEKAVNDLAIIYVRVTVNQKRVLISLKRKVSVELRDDNRKKVKGNSVEAKQINQYLYFARSRFYQCYQELTSKGKKVTSKLVKASFLGFDENTKTLQELIQYYSKKIERTLSTGTIRNFGITEGYVNKFLSKERNTSDLYLRELDYKFLCDFESFLQSYWPRAITGP